MNKIFLVLIFIMFGLVVVSNYYILYYKKDYNFILEAPCDTSKNTCFVRDCNSGYGCPPNNLNKYRIFKINAGDFNLCQNNSCLNECENKTISCFEIKCGDSDDDTCSVVGK